MTKEDATEKNYYHLIGECGEEYNGTNATIVTCNLELGIFLLKQVLGIPPAQGNFEVLWANYDEQLFLTIAIAYREVEIQRTDVADYEAKAERLLRHFNSCIDWGELNRIISET